MTERKKRTDNTYAEVLWLILGIGLFVLIIILANRNIDIKALYTDDLYLWSFYGEQNFWEYTFPLRTKGNFRPVYWAVSYLEFYLTGPHVEWYKPFNILLNTGAALQVQYMAWRMSRSHAAGLLAGAAYCFSHFAYYAIGQVMGVMETMALMFSLWVLFFLLRFIQERKDGVRYYCLASAAFFLSIFTHERFLALILLFLIVPAFSVYKRDQWKLELLPVGILGMFFLSRVLVAGQAMPVGTAGTQVTETFRLGEAMLYACQQVLYIFGINAGHAYLSGIAWADTVLWAKCLVFSSWAGILIVIFCYGRNLVLSNNADKKVCLGSHLLFILFIALCIGCSSITVRLEMRWIYVSYTAALLYLAFMIGGIQQSGKGKKAAFAVFGMAVYCFLMIPVQLYYRQYCHQIFFFFTQDRANALAEITIGQYGKEAVLGKKQIYIFFNYYEMTDFYAEYFYRPFDSEKTGQGTAVHFINDIAEIPADRNTENTILLLESGETRGYLDVTETYLGNRVQT